MHRLGSSIGNGAGCPTRVADSAGNSQTLFVYERNSCLLIVFCPAGRENEPFENTRRYSCVSRRDGFEADCQLPQAVDPPALDPLFQITSPLIRKPTSSMS